MVEISEVIGGNEYILASTPIIQSQLPSQTKITFSPTSSEVKVKFKYGTSGWTWHGHSICITKPVMVSETYYVDVCDETGDKYRFGFNTQEKVNEISGIGNHNTAEFWEYDTRVARRWNLDPVDQISISNYAVFANNPILNTDVKGDNPVIYLTPEIIAAFAATGAALSYLYYDYTTNKRLDWDGFADAFSREFDKISGIFSHPPAGVYIPPPSEVGVDGNQLFRLSERYIPPQTYPIVRTITHDKVKKEKKEGFYHVLYQMDDGEGNYYIGRTSGYGTPTSLVQKRAKNHHAKEYGFRLDTATPLLAFESSAGSYKHRNIDHTYYAIRAAEDSYIRAYMKLGKSGNRMVGVSDKNKSRKTYYDTYDTYIGSDDARVDKDNCVNCGAVKPTKPLMPR